LRSLIAHFITICRVIVSGLVTISPNHNLREVHVIHSSLPLEEAESEQDLLVDAFVLKEAESEQNPLVDAFVLKGAESEKNLLVNAFVLKARLIQRQNLVWHQYRPLPGSGFD
jgi:hypothetical protein